MRIGVCGPFLSWPLKLRDEKRASRRRTGGKRARGGSPKGARAGHGASYRSPCRNGADAEGEEATQGLLPREPGRDTDMATGGPEGYLMEI